MALLRGIDTNSYKPDLDVNAIAADFIIIKATGGTGYVNPICDRDYQRAKSGGKLVGVYHYYSDDFGGEDPIAEANWFVDNCSGYVGDAILILDWERGGNGYVTDVGRAKAWLDHVHARTGVKPIIYMSSSLVHELDWSPVIAGGYGLWAAAWPNGNNPVYNYGMDVGQDPNPRWDGNVNDVLWQFTSTGRIDGYGGNLDCNFFFGDANAWHAYARPDNQPAPAPTPPPAPEPTPEPPAPQPEPVPEPPHPSPEPVPEPSPEPSPVPEPPKPPVVPASNFIVQILKGLLYTLLSLFNLLRKGK